MVTTVTLQVSALNIDIQYAHMSKREQGNYVAMGTVADAMKTLNEGYRQLGLTQTESPLDRLLSQPDTLERFRDER